MIPGPRRGGALATLALAAAFAAAPVFADDRPVIGAVGDVTFLAVTPGSPTIYSADALRNVLKREIGRPCDPPRIEEAIAARYRSLGYVPMVRAGCDDGTVRIEVRESSHRIALITFEPSDLGRIGLAATSVE